MAEKEVLRVEYDSAGAQRNAEKFGVELAEVTTYALAQAKAFATTGAALDLAGDEYEVLPPLVNRLTAASDGLTDQERRLASSITAANVLLGDQADVAVRATTRLDVGLGAASKGTRNLGLAALEGSRALEDLQYGLAGVANNIPGLVSLLGGPAGLAAGISVAAVAIVQLVKHWDDIQKALGLGIPTPALEGLAALESGLKKARTELEELQEKSRLSLTERLRFDVLTDQVEEFTAKLQEARAAQELLTGPSREQAERGAGFKQALTEVGPTEAFEELRDKLFESADAAGKVTHPFDLVKQSADEVAKSLMVAAAAGDQAARAEIQRTLGGGSQFGQQIEEFSPEAQAEYERAEAAFDRSLDERRAAIKAREKRIEREREAYEEQKSEEDQLFRDVDRILGKEETTGETAEKKAERAKEAQRRKNRQEAEARDRPVIEGLTSGAGTSIEGLLLQNAIARQSVRSPAIARRRGIVSDERAAEVLTERLAAILQKTGADTDPLHARAVAGDVVAKAQERLRERIGQGLGQTQNLQAAMIQTTQQLANDLAVMDQRTAILWQQLSGVQRIRTATARTSQNRARNP